MLSGVAQWLRANVLRRRVEREMREEMEAHLERSAARLVGRGLSEAEARRAALLEFGNVTYIEEQARDARGTQWLDGLRADARFALRHFARRPLAALVMFVVLAVGMSISTLLFSYVHSYAVQPPAGIDARDAFRIRGSQDADGERVSRAFDEQELHDYMAMTQQFSAVAGWTDVSVVIDAGRELERRGLEARAAFVTGEWFDVLGVQPLLGAGLPHDTDPAAAGVAVINHAAWEEVFARSSEVIGANVTVNGAPVTIVGVMPERFRGVSASGRLQLWLPLSARELVVPQLTPAFRAVARLQPGMSTDAAAAAVQVVAQRQAARLGGQGISAPSADVVRLLSANSDPMFDRDVRLMSLAVAILGLLVLLITCTNVSALLTGLAAARRQEIAIRLSLGAARARVLRQLLTETALLASAAAAGALFIVWAALRAAGRYLPDMPFEMNVTPPAVAFTFGVALAVGLLFGLSPALHATRLGMASAMRDSAGSIAATRARLQRGLVVAQIAFTQPLIVLLAAVLLLILGNLQLQSRTPLAESVISVSLRFTSLSTDDAASREALRRTAQQLVEQYREIPGVLAAELDWGFERELGAFTGGRAGSAEPVQLGMENASPQIFDVLGMKLLRGRSFTAADVAAAAVNGASPVIIGAELARELWAGADPIGCELVPAVDGSDVGRLLVVGVVDDPLAGSREASRGYRVFMPPAADAVTPQLLVRTTGDARALLPDVRRMAQAAAPSMVAFVRTIAHQEQDRLMRFRTVTGGLMAAGVAALLLSALGLYAVIAFAVGQRTGEIAVRLAVGARGAQVVRRFLGDGLRLSMLGLFLGLPVSLVALSFLNTIDPDMPHIPLTHVTLIAMSGVLAVATLAVWIPARRAASVDPAVTLRREG